MIELGGETSPNWSNPSESERSAVKSVRWETAQGESLGAISNGGRDTLQAFPGSSSDLKAIRMLAGLNAKTRKPFLVQLVRKSKVNHLLDAESS